MKNSHLLQLPFYIPFPGGDRPRHVLGGTGCSSVSDTSLKCGAQRSTCAAGHGWFPQFRQHVLGTPHPRAQPLPAPTGATQVIASPERPCLIQHSGSLRGLRGRVMPVQWLICAGKGKGAPCGVCQCLFSKMCISRGVGQHKSWGRHCHSKKVFWGDPDVTQYLCTPISYLWSESRSCLGWGVLEGHRGTVRKCLNTTAGKEREHRATFDEIYISFTVMRHPLCHSSSTDKIKNSVGAWKEPDSFLKWAGI